MDNYGVVEITHSITNDRTMVHRPPSAQSRRTGWELSSIASQKGNFEEDSTRPSIEHWKA